MKILIYSDIHWTTYSSILRSRSTDFSTYLEGLIKSLNWAENLGREQQCSLVICAGDFFDKAECKSEELSALKKLNWYEEVEHYFLCGNHEMGSSNHTYSSTKLFNLLPNAKVIDKPTILRLDDFHEIDFLPYILEAERKSITEYFSDSFMKSKRILISHNDIAGLQLGSFISTAGFTIDELQKNFDLIINGHLHNGEKVADKVFNIGSLSAMNFSNDSSKYTYGVFILDTDTLSIDVYENPFAFNFYKFDATTKQVKFNNIKDNSVITLKCFEKDAGYYRELVKNNPKIIESRVILELSKSIINSEETVDLSVDHLSEFRAFILETLGTNDIVLNELDAICN